MIAPLELSRNANIVSGETAAAMTQRKPTTEDARIAVVALLDGSPQPVAAAPRGGRPGQTACARRCTSPSSTAQHRRQHHGVHDVVGIGNPHLA